jgi:hypothetical protein
VKRGAEKENLFSLKVKEETGKEHSSLNCMPLSLKETLHQNNAYPQAFLKTRMDHSHSGSFGDDCSPQLACLHQYHPHPQFPLWFGGPSNIYVSLFCCVYGISIG